MADAPTISELVVSAVVGAAASFAVTWIQSKRDEAQKRKAYLIAIRHEVQMILVSVATELDELNNGTTSATQLSAMPMSEQMVNYALFIGPRLTHYLAQLLHHVHHAPQFLANMAEVNQKYGDASDMRSRRLFGKERELMTIDVSAYLNMTATYANAVLLEIERLVPEADIPEPDLTRKWTLEDREVQHVARKIHRAMTATFLQRGFVPISDDVEPPPDLLPGLQSRRFGPTFWSEHPFWKSQLKDAQQAAQVES